MVDRAFRLGLLAAAVLAILGCGGSSSSGNGSNQAPAATANFSLSVPTEITVAPNSLQSISISVVPTNGFSSAVNVVLSGLPSGVTATPSTFTLTPATSAQRRVVAGVSAEDASTASSQTVTITAGAEVPPGPVNLVVTGTSGSLSQSTTTSTSQADFSLSASSQTVALAAGGTAQVSVYATSFDGFSGQIAATLAGLPAGVTASPSTLTLTPGTPQIVTLSAAADIQPGTTTLGLQGTSGALTNNIEFELALSATPIVAPDYSLSVNPSAITLSAGGNPGQVTLSAIPINGFTGPVAVSLGGLPSGVVAMPANFLLTPGIPQLISLTAASTATAGTTALLISTSTGVLEHTTEVPVTITPPPPSFSFEVTPASLTLNAGGSAQSVSITATALYGFSGTINVALSGLPAGVTASPASLTLTPGVTQAVNLTAASNAVPGAGALNLLASSGTISNSASVGLTIDTATPDFVFSATPSTITVTPGTFQPVVLSIVPLSGFNSGVTLTTGSLPDGVVVSPGIGFGGAGEYFPAPAPILPIAPNVPEVLYVGIPPGDSAPVTIDFHAAAGALTHSAAVTANPASTSNAGSDLYLTSARSGLMLYPGDPPNGAADVVINPVGFTINGNPGMPTISLTSSLPSGMTAAPVALYEDSAGLGMNFTVTSGQIGSSGILNFQAASGSSSGSMTREIDTPYSVVAGPELTQLPIPSPTLTLPQGSSEDFYIAVASTVPNDLTATDSLGGLPSGVTWAPMASYIPGTFPEQLTVPATTAVGQTLLTITISDYARTQTTSQFTLNVVNIPSFIITPTPSALKMVAGTTQTFTLEADAINGFTGEISVKLTALGGATVTPSTLTLTLGTPQQISISAPIASSTPNSNSNVGFDASITVQATAGTLSQSLIVPVDVTPPAAAP